jgi:hypothetical protein
MTLPCLRSFCSACFMQFRCCLCCSHVLQRQFLSTTFNRVFLSAHAGLIIALAVLEHQRQPRNFLNLDHLRGKCTWGTKLECPIADASQGYLTVVPVLLGIMRFYVGMFSCSNWRQRWAVHARNDIVYSSERLSRTHVAFRLYVCNVFKGACIKC